MTWVCGAGIGIPLPNLQSHPRQSSLFSKATYPLQILCKTSKTVTNPLTPPVPPISSIPRRQLAVPLVGLALLLNFSQPAQAQDIPLFGIKKLKKLEEEVAKEAQELVKEGQQGAEKVVEEVKEIAQDLKAKASSIEGQAQDIPFFGIKKLKKVEEEVAKEAQELVKEGEQGAEKVAKEVKGIAQDLEAKASSFEGSAPAPVLQAGLVAGAEFIGVLVASSVVNNIVGPEPSK